ncbi:hypothetical protein KUTeg_010364 [Tegillarca granosa]|uniref:p-glycoprotein n=1 Tax=Tegillarca granosa TaxID=220873 RepID=A0ABQ9F8Q2_TEGGR|nr:hypothetical protein KUTeg_010364 [Tegillarca granosa]
MQGQLYIICFAIAIADKNSRTTTLECVNSNDKDLKDEDECKPLLNQDNNQGGSSDTSEDGVKKGTIFRLLSMSKPDIKLILCAAFFLVVSSTGQIFIPYYTGKVVDGIVIDKSQKEFTSAIIIMACISAGRHQTCIEIILKSCQDYNTAASHELSTEVQDSLAKANDVAEEACSSVRTVRSFANEDGEKQRYNKALQNTYKLNKKQAVVYAGYVWCIQEIGDVYTGLMQASGASEKISLVGQEPVLYARTVKENISYGLTEDDYDFDSIQRAAEMANAHQFISEMKDKYETQTGEKGVQMSGGQKQRIAIARALIRNPSLLLLDEATSALDSESEHVVQQAMYQNLKGRTVIIIAHRLSTVERADRIIVIDKGTIAEQGSHKELLQNEGLYAKLVQRQLLGFEDSDTVKKQNVKDGIQQGVEIYQCNEEIFE